MLLGLLLIPDALHHCQPAQIAVLRSLLLSQPISKFFLATRHGPLPPPTSLSPFIKSESWRCDPTPYFRSNASGVITSYIVESGRLLQMRRQRESWGSSKCSHQKISASIQTSLIYVPCYHICTAVIKTVRHY
jgi:hypothetical protein